MHNTYDLTAIFVVDGDQESQSALCQLLTSVNYNCQCFDDAEHALQRLQVTKTYPACIISEAQTDKQSSIRILRELAKRHVLTPTIFLAAHANIDNAVLAMKSGAHHYFRKPYNSRDLLLAISNAIGYLSERLGLQEEFQRLNQRFDGLTRRENQILTILIDGQSNKDIANQLHLSVKTVEFHRANLMKKTNSKNLVDLVRSYARYEFHTHHLRRNHHLSLAES